MEIILQPIEKDIGNDILNLLYDSLSTAFNKVNVKIAPTLKVEIQKFMNRQRNQIKSPLLLHWILEKNETNKRNEGSSYLRYGCIFWRIKFCIW
jgi:predicted Zn-dependent protease